MRVEVYWNIRRKVFSVRHKGKVIAHRGEIVLKNVMFVVQPAGQALVRKKKVKNIHAFVKGDLVVDLHETRQVLDSGIKTELWYNPYEVDTFVTYKDKKPVKFSTYAHLWSKQHTKGVFPRIIGIDEGINT